MRELGFYALIAAVYLGCILVIPPLENWAETHGWPRGPQFDHGRLIPAKETR